MVSEGDRVELVNTSDKYTTLEPGDRGTVTDVSEIPAGDIPGQETQVWIDWDEGSSLALLASRDEFKVVDDG